MSTWKTDAGLFHIDITNAARSPRRGNDMRALFLGFQNTSIGHGEISEFVVYHVHCSSGQGLLSFLGKEWQLFPLVAEIGDPHPQEPDRLRKDEGVQNADRLG